MESSAAGVFANGWVVASGFEPSVAADSGGCVSPPIFAVSDAVPGEEFRPTMYPMEKNTPSKTTTITNTLMSWRFPSTSSNSPSSFFGKLDLAFQFLFRLLLPGQVIDRPS